MGKLRKILAFLVLLITANINTADNTKKNEDLRKLALLNKALKRTDDKSSRQLTKEEIVKHLSEFVETEITVKLAQNIAEVTKK